MLLKQHILQQFRTGFFVLERSFFFFFFFFFFSRVSELIQMRQRSPWLWNDILYSLSPSGREHKRCLKILHDFTNKVITIDNNNGNNRNDDDGDDDDDDDDIYDLMCVRHLASSVFAYSQKSFIALFCSSEKLAWIFSLKDRSRSKMINF